MFLHQTSTVLLSITCILVVYGGGKLEVKFVRYVNPGGLGDNGNCCDGFSVCFSSCDHEFTLCIDDVSGPDSVSSCKFGVKRSGEISEANTIDFSSKVGNLDNPMVFSFNSWPGAVKVKVDIWDIDDSSGHDFVDFLSRLFASSPGPDVNKTKWYEFQLSKRTRLNSQVRVYCDTNFYGDFCNKSCIPSARNETGQYYCDSDGNLVCKQHYFGSTCTRYCEPHNDSTGHYACDVNTGDLVCLDGWKGSNCLEDIDECAVNNSATNLSGHEATSGSSACSFQGNCTNLEGGFRCVCQEHYTGEMCDEVKLYCSNITCANNGTCMNTFGGYMCHCNDQWTGEQCEIELTPCTYYPCHNNGICNIQGDSYNCTCDERFTGDHCETEVTIPSTTERVQVVSQDAIIVFLVGYLNESDNNILIEGIHLLIEEYGSLKEDITLEIVKHKVTLKDGGELTQVEITAICTTANIDGLLARIFTEHAQEELDKYLPLPLYKGNVEPYMPTEYQEKSWVSRYWFVIFIIVLGILTIVVGAVAFFIIKRRRDNLKNRLAGDTSGVEEICPNTAIGFDNSLYFNVNQPEKVAGLPEKTQREQS